MRNLRVAAVLLLTPLSIFAQEFEVASIKPSAPPEQGQGTAGVHIDGAMVRCTSLSLNDYLGIAYTLKNYQLSGPEWLASSRFDITAKLPEGADGKQIPAMLQALLRDRFQMKTHRETKDLPVYGLVRGKGELKLKQSEETPAESGDAPKAVDVAASGSEAGTIVRYGNGAYFTFGDNKFEGRKLPMTAMADVLARFADKPVVEMTGLQGNYDFTLTFSTEDYRAMMVRAALAAGVTLPPAALKLLDASGDTLFTAVESLGLKLDARKAPLEVLVIDQVLKAPTDN